MARQTQHLSAVCVGLAVLVLVSGCTTTTTAHHYPDNLTCSVDHPTPLTQQPDVVPQSLEEMVALAQQANPRLRALAARVDAAWAKVPQVGALPDPTLGANVFGHPIETAAGSQRANMTLGQRLPSLKRLAAQEQRAAVEAAALHETLRAEKLKLIADVKTLYYQLDLLDKQIEIHSANHTLLDSIVRVELARVASAGSKTASNDTLRASVERGRLAETHVALEQRRKSLQARLNELLNRPSEADLPTPTEPTFEFTTPDLETLRATAEANQPELVAAHLRTKAEQWGIEVAGLARFPDVTLNASWYFIENNRPATRVVDVGQDAWTIGATINLPLCSDKYDALYREAEARHAAAAYDVQSVRRKYDAWLEDWLEKARAADETIRLYDKSILPQARSTLRVDRKSFGAGNVDFDRLMNDLRTLINLEVNRYRAKSQLAIALTRIEQGVGIPWEKLAPPKSTQPENDHGNDPDGKPERLPEPEQPKSDD